MTTEEILKLEAGRELDALIAIHVFRRTDVQYGDGEISWNYEKPSPQVWSTSVRAAWEVVDKVPAKIAIWPVTLNGGGWAACIGNELATVMTSGWSGTCTAKAETPALAICRCALLWAIRSPQQTDGGRT